MSEPSALPIAGDAISGSAIVASWGVIVMGYAAPAGTIMATVASLAAAIFYAIQVYESKFIQGWIAGRLAARIAKLTVEIAQLQAKAKVTATVIETLQSK